EARALAPVPLGPAPQALQLAALPLGGQAPPARGGRGPGWAALRRLPERLRELGPEPLEGELAVPRLASRVLRDGAHPLAEHAPQAFALGDRERARLPDVEDRLGARSGDVGVLSAGPGRAAVPQPYLRERDLGALPDREGPLHEPGRASSGSGPTCRAPRRARRCRPPARGSAW